jgi:hypothetical protein
MTVSRRRLLQSVALSTGFGATIEGAEPAITLDVLRDVSLFHGTNLSDDRLRVVQPALEYHIAELRAFRDFEADDSVAPTQGI